MLPISNVFNRPVNNNSIFKPEDKELLNFTNEILTPLSKNNISSEKQYYEAMYNREIISISEDEKNALEAYTVSASRDINAYLRQQPLMYNDKEDVEKILPLIDDALDKLPKCDEKVYRKTGISEFTAKCIKKGIAFKDPAYLSTSTCLDVCKLGTFSEGSDYTLWMRIDKHDGRIINNPNELEVLQKKGETFLVNECSVNHTSRTVIIIANKLEYHHADSIIDISMNQNY